MPSFPSFVLSDASLLKKRKKNPQTNMLEVSVSQLQKLLRDTASVSMVTSPRRTAVLQSQIALDYKQEAITMYMKEIMTAQLYISLP